MAEREKAGADCELCDEPEGAVCKRADGTVLCDGCDRDNPVDDFGLADEREFYDR